MAVDSSSIIVGLVTWCLNNRYHRVMSAHFLLYLNAKSKVLTSSDERLIFRTCQVYWKCYLTDICLNSAPLSMASASFL